MPANIWEGQTSLQEVASSSWPELANSPLLNSVCTHDSQTEQLSPVRYLPTGHMLALHNTQIMLVLVLRFL